MKRKRTNKKALYICLCVVVILVLTLTIAYAVLSSTLTISGTTEISSSSWNITIDKLDFWNDGPLAGNELYCDKTYYNGLAIGDAELIKEPNISGTTISDLQISLTKAQDVIGLYYTVTNNGTIPAKIESIIQSTPTFTSSTNNASDIELISNNWFSAINLYNIDSNFDWSDVLDVGYVLCPGEMIYFEFYGEIKYDATSVSSSDITVSNLGGTINFVQADKSVCSSS